MNRVLSGYVIAAFALLATAATAQTPVTPAAPAPQQQAKPDWLSYKNPYAAATGDISIPHRTNEEVANWTQQTAADLLTFSPGDYRSKLTAGKSYFSPAGWQLFADYLTNSKLLVQVTENNYGVSTIVSSPPEIVKQAASGGVFHWIVRLPITISTTSIRTVGTPGKNLGENTLQNVTHSEVIGKYILYTDVMRTASTLGDALIINNWRVDALATTTK